MTTSQQFQTTLTKLDSLKRSDCLDKSKFNEDDRLTLLQFDGDISEFFSDIKGKTEAIKKRAEKLSITFHPDKWPDDKGLDDKHKEAAAARCAKFIEIKEFGEVEDKRYKNTDKDDIDLDGCTTQDYIHLFFFEHINFDKLLSKIKDDKSKGEDINENYKVDIRWLKEKLKDIIEQRNLSIAKRSFLRFLSWFVKVSNLQILIPYKQIIFQVISEKLTINLTRKEIDRKSIKDYRDAIDLFFKDSKPLNSFPKIKLFNTEIPLIFVAISPLLKNITLILLSSSLPTILMLSIYSFESFSYLKEFPSLLEKVSAKDKGTRDQIKDIRDYISWNCGPIPIKSYKFTIGLLLFKKIHLSLGIPTFGYSFLFATPVIAASIFYNLHTQYKKLDFNNEYADKKRLAYLYTTTALLDFASYSLIFRAVNPYEIFNPFHLLISNYIGVTATFNAVYFIPLKYILFLNTGFQYLEEQIHPEALKPVELAILGSMLISGYAIPFTPFVSGILSTIMPCIVSSLIYSGLSSHRNKSLGLERESTISTVKDIAIVSSASFVASSIFCSQMTIPIFGFLTPSLKFITILASIFCANSFVSECIPIKEFKEGFEAFPEEGGHAKPQLL